MGTNQTDRPAEFLQPTDGILASRWSRSRSLLRLSLRIGFSAVVYVRDGTSLYVVESLTLKERTIAARMKRGAPEQIDGIRPVREKRQQFSKSAWERRQARWEVECANGTGKP